MTTLDLMNNNYTSEISVSEMNEIANFMHYLNNLDQAIWEQMREELGQ